MMKGKSAEEIRQIFNIKNDFTPEEEDQIRRENEWAEDDGTETPAPEIAINATETPVPEIAIKRQNSELTFQRKKGESSLSNNLLRTACCRRALPSRSRKPSLSALLLAHSQKSDGHKLTMIFNIRSIQFLESKCEI
jgi:hypothetical protein